MVNDALRSLGIPIGDVNSETFEDEAFFSRVPMTLKDSYVRLGTFRDDIKQNSINPNIQLCHEYCYEFSKMLLRICKNALEI